MDTTIIHYSSHKQKKENKKINRPKLDNTNTPIHAKGQPSHADQAVFDSAKIVGSPKSSSSDLSVLNPIFVDAEKSPATTAPLVCANTDVQDKILAEIRKLRYEMNEKFDNQQASLMKFEASLCTVQKDITNLSVKFSSMYEDLEELKKAVTFLSDAHDEQKKVNTNNNNFIAKFTKDNAKLSAEVKQLDIKIQQMDQLARESNIEIQCVPEHKTENLLTIVQQLARVTGYELRENEIQSFHRIAKMNAETNRPRSIVVKLASPRVRDNLLAAVRNFNKKNEAEKLNTSHIGIGGEKKPIFVTENLTLANKKLHAATRTAAKERKYNFVWIRNGRIFVRKDVTTKPQLIQNMECVESM
ncbi:hypothetical protein B5X24_HaOG208304 [Helicoverpa armigera]|nr:hypothetical protein B5X24_HaOG208304 [Helicoverpa armigera]